MNVDPEDLDDFDADERVLSRADDPDGCVLVRGASILLTTLAVLLPLFVFGVRELLVVTRADRDGVITLEVREDRFEFARDVTLLREEREEAERLAELLEATSTVRFTGRERDALLRVERVGEDGLVFDELERDGLETVGILGLEARDTVRFCGREDRDTLGADGVDRRDAEADRLLRLEVGRDAGAEDRAAGADR